MDDRVNEQIRREWRDLGFFYRRDDVTREWRLVGSRSGLLRLCGLLKAYVQDPRNKKKSEHEHYGPYYLEVMTWSEAGMDGHAIHGTLEDLDRLASLVESRIASLDPGASVRIGDEFAVGTEYSLVLELRSDGFDPASEDAQLTE